MLLDHILGAGPVATVLLMLSVLALALMLERVWVQLSYPHFSAKSFAALRQNIRSGAFDSACEHLTNTRHGWQRACTVLINKRHLQQPLRQQFALEWLLQERRYLNARLKLLGLIAALAPLLGLLGTVFGIIEMFKTIAHNTGPVTPALLAEGMWTAMVTTALGLLIAIPTMAVAHGFDLLTQRRLNTIQDALNDMDRLLEGIDSSVVAAISSAEYSDASAGAPPPRVVGAV